jgi:hypothetical protein
MAIIGYDTGNTQAPRRGARGLDRELPVLPLLTLAFFACAAVVYIFYVLWPRWPEEPALDAPELPVTVADVTFNVQPAAIRVAVQRRAGAHDRIDLAFAWPSLTAPNSAVKPVVGPGLPPAAAKMLDRIFVTIAVSGDALAPDERVHDIYPRYASATPATGPGGLAILPFRDGTPYAGEDLIYDPNDPDSFLVRCTRVAAGPAPGSCLYERRIGGAGLTVRFPRDFLEDRSSLTANIDRLIAKLRPHQ